MKRKLFTAASVLSLVMCVATVVLWVQSKRRIDLLTCHNVRVVRAISGDGVICLQWVKILYRERTVKVARSPGARTIVPASEFVDKPVTYGKSKFLERRRDMAGMSTEAWPGRHADWRFVSTNGTQWQSNAAGRPLSVAEVFTRSAWVDNPHPALPRLLPASFVVWRSMPARDEHDIDWREELVGMTLWIPYWVVFVLTFPMPAICAYRLSVRRTRFRHNCCCGYNLTGNTSGVCPECGTPVAVKALT